jgi:DNA-binding winged helix-turn-helix (wHTH) protein
MAGRTLSQLVRFGVYEVDLRSGELRKNGLKLKLSGQPFQVLALLLERPGDLVTREEIQKRLWPADTFVDFDHNLNTAINKIREALGDSAENPRFLETLPRRGYRFIVPVDSAGVAAEPSPGPANTGPLSPTGRGSRVPLQPARDRWAFRLAAMLAMFAVGAAVVWYARERSRPKPELIQHQLTTHSSELAVRAAAISPDGRYLAYADDSGIHLKVVDTAEMHDLPTPAGSRINNLAWFSEGNRVLASAEAGDPAVFSLWTISILGGAPQKLRDDAWDGNVFPDGVGIVFVSSKGKEIWRMGPEGEEAWKLVTASEGESYAVPVVVKGRLWYQKLSPGVGGFQVESRDLNGGPPTVLVPYSPEIFAFLLLPNGRFIYSRTNRPGLFYGGIIWEIWVDVRTGLARSTPRELADTADFEAFGLSATADGRRLTFLKERSSLVSVYVGELEGNGSRIVNPRRLTLSDSLDHAYAWAPDSKSVLFDSNRNGTWDIFRQSLDQRMAEKLVTSPGSNRPAMSPDGDSVLYLTFPTDSGPPESAYYSPRKIMRVALTGGPPQWLGDIQ